VIGAIEVNRIKESSEEYGVKAGNFSTLIGDKQRWGKRIAPYAKRAVMEWGFSEGGFELFIGKALTSNARSWRSLERLGFEFRGLKPDTVNGRPAEWRVYVMTKQHWQRYIEVPFSNGYYYPPEPRAQVLELLKLEQSGEVLDIGAGFGNNILPLLGYDFKITATETNPDCIAGLKQLAVAHPGRIKVIDQSLESLAVDRLYDAVICTMVLHFLNPSDGRVAIAHMKQWTKPGGINIVTSYTTHNPEEQLREHGVRFLLEGGELKSAYKGWEILSYEEASGTSKNALGTAFESARLIARKPRG
jgi:SAM-dependent methyltransferase